MALVLALIILALVSLATCGAAMYVYFNGERSGFNFLLILSLLTIASVTGTKLGDGFVQGVFGR